MKGGAASDQAGCGADGDEIEASWDRVQAETGSTAGIEMQGKLGRFSIKLKKNQCEISHFWSWQMFWSKKNIFSLTNPQKLDNITSFDGFIDNWLGSYQYCPNILRIQGHDATS